MILACLLTLLTSQECLQRAKDCREIGALCDDLSKPWAKRAPACAKWRELCGDTYDLECPARHEPNQLPKG